MSGASTIAVTVIGYDPRIREGVETLHSRQIATYVDGSGG
jgi:hypothetical protein